MQWDSIRHLVKLDPDKPADECLIEKVVESGTDGVVVGGTQNITREKVLKLFRLLKPYPILKFLEVSCKDAITFGFDKYLIPIVLNSASTQWIIGAHQEVVKKAGNLIDWNGLIPEGYIVLNPDSAVAQLTQAITSLSKQDVWAYASCGENLFSLPIIYIEYSGLYGDPELLKHAKTALNKSRLFYGGGIDNGQKAEEMAKFCDAIVVGNMVYTDKIKYLKETVKAVKG